MGTVFKTKIFFFLQQLSYQTLFPLANMSKYEQLVKTNTKPAVIFVVVSDI